MLTRIIIFPPTVAQFPANSHFAPLKFRGERRDKKGAMKEARNIKQKTVNVWQATSNEKQKTIESGLDRLIISIDGTTQETYQSYRVGGQLSKVIEGAKNIVKWKKELNAKTPYIIFQFLVVKPNEHQIDDLKLLAKEIGVDEVVLKTAQVYDYKYGNELIPENEQYSRYKKNNDGTYSIKNSLENNCWKLWHSCVITWDGKVVPCCFDKDAQYQLGDLQTHSFSTIWNNDLYKDFRVKLVK